MSSYHKKLSVEGLKAKAMALQKDINICRKEGVNYALSVDLLADCLKEIKEKEDARNRI